MATSASYREFIEKQLSNFDLAAYRKMFGGVGVFREKVMFGLISSQDHFYLRTDETNRDDFEAHKMSNFNPRTKGKGMPYHEVPEEILNDPEKLIVWAEKAFEVALANKKK